jgi:murein DD-endopeptidase MepM/ murein hydrolase activator NlpD
MKIKDLRYIKNILIITSSEKPSAESKRINISLRALVSILALYSFFIFVAGFLIINLTPLSKMFYTEDFYYQKEEKVKLIELNKKVSFLSKEIENLKSTNERLKYAIILGDSNLFKEGTDSLKLNRQKIKKKVDGNLFSIFLQLIENFLQSDNKDVFFIRPANGFLSREFNPEEGHYGIDLAAKTGMPIYASAGGYVIFSDYTVEDGYMIIIVHPNDYISIYKHCSSLIKRKREKILQGELIALTGNTGHGSHGPHLHFEIWRNGIPINPLKHLIN